MDEIVNVDEETRNYWIGRTHRSRRYADEHPEDPGWDVEYCEEMLTRLGIPVPSYEETFDRCDANNDYHVTPHKGCFLR